MDYRASFHISGMGMAVEKARLDVTAVNLANVHSSQAPGGSLFSPLRVVSQQDTGAFAAALAGAGALLGGPRVLSIEGSAAAPRTVYDPGHPHADEKGFVAFPAIDAVGEMVTLMTAVRAYEANVVAMGAAKSMALKALEIGAGP